MSKSGLSVDKALISKAPRKRETWSQVKRTGDNTEEICVEKLDNEGYLVIISKNWYDAKRNWHDKEVKLFSKENPLDKNEQDNPVDTLFSALSGFKL